MSIFKTPQQLRNYKPKGFFRGIRKGYIKFRTQRILNGGWHFTWMGGVEKIILKLMNTAHQEFNKPENLIPEEIEKKIRSGGSPDILNRKEPGWSVKLFELNEVTAPLYLYQHRLKHLR